MLAAGRSGRLAGMHSERELRDIELLARVRRGLRSLNDAIARGALQAGLTMQQQAFLLAVRAYGGTDVPLADVREELEMDAATASILLARLVHMGLVTRRSSEDRRASQLSLTLRGRAAFKRSVTHIRAEIRGAEHRSELDALRDDLSHYLGYYLPDTRPRGRSGTVKPSPGRTRGRSVTTRR